MLALQKQPAVTYRLCADRAMPRRSSPRPTSHGSPQPQQYMHTACPGNTFEPAMLLDLHQAWMTSGYILTQWLLHHHSALHHAACLRMPTQAVHGQHTCHLHMLAPQKQPAVTYKLCSDSKPRRSSHVPHHMAAPGHNNTSTQHAQATGVSLVCCWTQTKCGWRLATCQCTWHHLHHSVLCNAPCLHMPRLCTGSTHDAHTFWPRRSS